MDLPYHPWEQDTEDTGEGEEKAAGEVAALASA